MQLIEFACLVSAMAWHWQIYWEERETPSWLLESPVCVLLCNIREPSITDVNREILRHLTTAKANQATT